MRRTPLHGWFVAAGLGLLAAACAATHGTLSDDVDFDDGDGNRRYEIEPDEWGYEVTDGDKREICDFRRESDGAFAGSLRIEGANDEILGHVMKHDGSVSIFESGKDAVVCELSVGAEGDVRIDSPAGLLYTLERRANGYKIVDANGKLAGRVERDDKLEITDARGRTQLKSKDQISTLAAACMGLQSIRIEYRLALLVGVVEYRVGE